MTRHALLLFLLLGLASCASEQASTSVLSSSERTKSNRIEYPTVAAAFAALRSRPDLTIHQENGWTGFEDRANLTIWTFTPPGHPAHPTVVKRTIVQEGTKIYTDVTARCEATKPACDKLMAEFQVLNENIREYVRRSGQGAAQPGVPADAPQAARP